MPFFFKSTALTIISLTTIILLGGLVGCAGDKVGLAYNSLGPSMNASPELPTVAIPEFQNGMPSTQIGVSSGGKPLEANSSTITWVTEAFTDELVRLGVRANDSSYPRVNDYMVSGSLDQLWIEETGPAQYSVKVAITIELTQPAGQVIFKKTFNAEQNTFFVPTDANISELVESTLRDVLTMATVEVKSQLPRI